MHSLSTLSLGSFLSQECLSCVCLPACAELAMLKWRTLHISPKKTQFVKTLVFLFALIKRLLVWSVCSTPPPLCLAKGQSEAFGGFLCLSRSFPPALCDGCWYIQSPTLRLVWMTLAKLLRLMLCTLLQLLQPLRRILHTYGGLMSHSQPHKLIVIWRPLVWKILDVLC